ncbi:hypothetical protein BD410DRAFT_797452, partial [Rickenella mellea]
MQGAVGIVACSFGVAVLVHAPANVAHPLGRRQWSPPLFIGLKSEAPLHGWAKQIFSLRVMNSALMEENRGQRRKETGMWG